MKYCVNDANEFISYRTGFSDRFMIFTRYNYFSLWITHSSKQDKISVQITFYLKFRLLSLKVLSLHLENFLLLFYSYPTKMISVNEQRETVRNFLQQILRCTVLVQFRLVRRALPFGIIVCVVPSIHASIQHILCSLLDSANIFPSKTPYFFIIHLFHTQYIFIEFILNLGFLIRISN